MSLVTLAIPTLAAAALLGAAPTASAQAFAGQLVEARTGQPLRDFPVRLIRLPVPDSSSRTDSTTTDERGLFQIPGRGIGRYRLEFGPSRSRLESSVEEEAPAADTTTERRYGIPVLELGGAQAYSARDVQRVANQRKVVPLRFPASMRSMGQTGEVMVRYVVEPSGLVRPGSVDILRSTHPTFTRTVLDALRTMTFEPARIGGIAVPQVVEQPFTFSFTAPK